jgi:hypothetical protein
MLKDVINQNILNTIYSEIKEANKDKYRMSPDVISKDSISTIKRKISMMIAGENNTPKDIEKNEVIKVYPLGDYSMYETLVTLTSKQVDTEEILDTFYFLILVTPDNRILNCKFVDLTLLTGRNIEECDKYEALIMNEAENTFTNTEDVQAFQSFIKLIREIETNDDI